MPRITDLPVSTSVSGDDLLVMVDVQDNTTQQTTINDAVGASEDMTTAQSDIAALQSGKQDVLTFPLSITQGGTGTDMVTTSTLPSPSVSGITNLSIRQAVWGKLVSISVSFSLSASLASGTTLYITIPSFIKGAISNAYIRTRAVVSTYALDGYIGTNDGTMGVRNLMGTAVPSGQPFEFLFLYLAA